jgi:hypothetical protein
MNSSWSSQGVLEVTQTPAEQLPSRDWGLLTPLEVPGSNERMGCVSSTAVETEKPGPSGGTVSTAEKEKLYLMEVPEQTVMSLIGLFEAIDRDHSDSLDIQEICEFWKRGSLGHAKVTPSDFEDDFKREGKELNARLDFAESVNVLISSACLAALTLNAVCES